MDSGGMGSTAAVKDAEVIRALFAAFACRDVDAALALFEEDCSFWPQGTAKRAGRQGPYRGHGGIREYFTDVDSIWESLEIHAHSVRAVHGGCTVFGVATGKPLDGDAMEVPVIWVFRLHAGRVSQGKAVVTAAQATKEHADAESR